MTTSLFGAEAAAALPAVQLSFKGEPRCAKDVVEAANALSRAYQELRQHAADEAERKPLPQSQNAPPTPAPVPAATHLPPPVASPSPRPSVIYPGLPAGQLPPPSAPPPSADSQRDAVFAKFHSLTGAERTRFYEENEEILSQPRDGATVINPSSRHPRAEVRERLERNAKPRAAWTQRDHLMAQLDTLSGDERHSFVREHHYELHCKE